MKKKHLLFIKKEIINLKEVLKISFVDLSEKFSSIFRISISPRTVKNIVDDKEKFIYAF